MPCPCGRRTAPPAPTCRRTARSAAPAPSPAAASRRGWPRRRCWARRQEIGWGLRRSGATQPMLKGDEHAEGEGDGDHDDTCGVSSQHVDGREHHGVFSVVHHVLAAVLHVRLHAFLTGQLSFLPPLLQQRQLGAGVVRPASRR
eukprot:scaffold1311_cov256-Pinguiococcus_pyrenoidosus.AAC.16